MNDDASNTKSRKMASRLMLGTAVLALPLTASVTYAESLAPEPPAPPAVTAVAPLPPAPPAPPAVMGLVQAAPEAPEAPEIVEEEETVVAIVTVDPDTGERKTVDLKGKDTARFISKDGKQKVIVLKNGEGADWTELKKRYDGEKEFVILRERMEDLQVELSELEDMDDLEDLKDLRKEMKRLKIINKGQGMEDAEIEVVIKEMREGLAEAREATKLARIELKALENSEEFKAMLKEGQGRTFVTMSCDSGSDEVATTLEREDGTTEVKICQTRVMAHALEGLEQARAAIAENEEITGKMRKEILKELDQQIKSWRKDAR